MPRKPTDEQPLYEEGKMSDETRRKVFGGSGPHQEKGAREEGDEERERHYSGASEAGSGSMPNNSQNT